MARKRRKKNRKYIVWLLIVALLLSLAGLGYVYRFPLKRQARYIYHTYFRSTPSQPPKKLQSQYALGVALPKDHTVFGADVSRHQGKIKWEKLSKFRFDGHKIEFVFIKATEGENWQDSQFEYNWKKAQKYKILRGAYHFYRPKVHSSKQMKNFTELVKMEKGDLPPVLDVEIESSLPKSTYRKGVLNCLKIMETTYGVKPIIYTNQKLYREYFKHKNFKDYRFWISRLKSTPPRMDSWHFWQFTYEAVVKGTNEYVDMNAFNGSKQQLLDMTKK
jgi:lysozyme